MSFRPCLLITRYDHAELLAKYLPRLYDVCPRVLVAENIPDGIATPPTSLHMPCDPLRGEALYAALPQAKEWRCTHIVSFELLEDTPEFFTDIAKIVAQAQENPLDIILGQRDFTQPCPLRLRFERIMSSFWLRVQTGRKVSDVHTTLRAYPIDFLQCLHIQDTSYAFEAESLVRGAWGQFDFQQVPVSMPSSSTWIAPKIPDYIKLISCNVRLTVRALVPLPFKRRQSNAQNIAEPISLKRPLQSLRQLMEDPYNRATPKDLARTAAIAIAVLTVPAPIIQSVALLLFIGWFRLNRLCALAMIPFTWPPFLPAMAILLGYRVRHGHWLNEFSVQTLGYEAGQRLWEWVIGSLLLTPVFALIAGCVVGGLAFMVAKKKD